MLKVASPWCSSVFTRNGKEYLPATRGVTVYERNHLTCTTISVQTKLTDSQQKKVFYTSGIIEKFHDIVIKPSDQKLRETAESVGLSIERVPNINGYKMI